MEATLKEKVDIIDEQIKEAKTKLAEFEETREDIRMGRSFGSWEDVNASIRNCEYKVRELNGKKEWVIAQTYLEKKGINMDIYPEHDSTIRVSVVKFGDKRYLEYNISYYNTNGKREEETEKQVPATAGDLKYKRAGDTVIVEKPADKKKFREEDYVATQKGSVIYTSGGEILFSENTIEKEERHYASEMRFSDDTNYSYSGTYNAKEGRIILEDAEDLIICMIGGGVTFKDNYHFKLKDGQYSLAHVFDWNDTGWHQDKPFKLLKTTDGTKLGEYNGRLYDIGKGEYLTDFHFEFMMDTESKNLPDFDCEAKGTLKEIMTTQNAVLGYISNYTGRYTGQIYGLVDTKGNLADNLVYFVEEGRHGEYFVDELGHPQIFSVPVTNETFNDTVYKTIEESIKRIAEEREAEIAREREASEKEWTLKDKINKATRQHILSNGISFSSKPKKLELTPEELSKYDI